jgi:virginiamycin B lyase
MRNILVETLESRCLLSLTINEFAVLTRNSGPFGIAAGADGNLWFTETSSNPSHVGEINPVTHVVNEFPVPTVTAIPTFITAGPDGGLWFTELEGNKIGRIDTTTHAIAEFPVPTGESEPEGITAGPDGNLWFTEINGGKIGQINPTTHAIAEFPVPTASSKPLGIAAGADGNLWFVEQLGNKIGEINPSTHAFAEFPIPTANAFLEEIAAGPDGNLWFTEAGANKIGEINPLTHAIAEFPVPNLNPGGSEPYGISAGPDGNLWFTFIQDGFIGDINPTTHAIAEFSFVGSGGEGSVTTGPDGNLWFVGQSDDFIGQAVLPAAGADLSLEGRAPASVTLGNNVTYSLTVTNNGTHAAAGVTLADTVPAKATFVSATGGVTPVGGVLNFAIGSLAAGASANLTITITPQAAGALVDGATATFAQSDPTPADNSIMLTTTVSSPATADLRLSGSAPSSVAIGAELTDTLTVTDNGAAPASGVAIADILPSGVTFVSATGGIRPVDGVLHFAIGSLAAGASATVTIVVSPLTAGVLRESATVTGDQNDPSPADNSTIQLINVKSNGPQVTSVRRFGFHAQPTRLVLTFSEPLDAGRADDPNNYQIVALKAPHRGIRIKTAVYDRVAESVTLTPVHSLNLHNLFRLTVIGNAPNGVTDTAGNPLYAVSDGVPTMDFVAIVSAADLVLTGADGAINRAYRKILLEQRALVKDTT